MSLLSLYIIYLLYEYTAKEAGDCDIWITVAASHIISVVTRLQLLQRLSAKIWKLLELARDNSDLYENCENLYNRNISNCNNFNEWSNLDNCENWKMYYSWKKHILSPIRHDCDSYGSGAPFHN